MRATRIAAVVAGLVALLCLGLSSAAYAQTLGGTDGADTDGYVPDEKVLSPGEAGTDGGTAPATAAFVETSAAASSSAAGSSATLPNTGANSLPTAQVAVALVAAGTGLVVLAGKRRSAAS